MNKNILVILTLLLAPISMEACCGAVEAWYQKRKKQKTTMRTIFTRPRPVGRAEYNDDIEALETQGDRFEKKLEAAAEHINAMKIVIVRLNTRLEEVEKRMDDSKRKNSASVRPEPA